MTDHTHGPSRKPHLSLETTEPMFFGYGFISGLLSAILGIAGFAAVLCLHFPQYLTYAELRPLYSLGYPAGDHPRGARGILSLAGGIRPARGGRRPATLGDATGLRSTK